jgi:hypothetical protein
MFMANQPGSMGSLLDAASKEAKRHPDLVLSAHASLYVRYRRDQDGRQVPYVVAGTGGYWSLKKFIRSPEAPASGVKVAAYDGAHHGFLRIMVTKGKIVGEYFTIESDLSRTGDAPVVADRFEVDLATKPGATSRD